MKVLVLTMDITNIGGIGNYFNILKNKFHVPVEYLITGKRARESGLFSYLKRFISDYSTFQKKVAHYDLVHINTSMRIKSFVRDAVFLWLGKRAGKTCLVFIHGWNWGFVRFHDTFFPNLYPRLFFRADGFIVLANEFKDKLRSWGYQKKTYLLSTLVDDELLAGFGKDDIQKRIQENYFNVLFLARIESEKGIYTSLDAVKRLSELHNGNIRLSIAGTGGELKRAKEYALSIDCPAEFLGFVKDDDRRPVFRQADVYLFPTQYGEGMPTSLLEAMSFGLPVITTSVGGVKDFFEHGMMGFLCEQVSPAECAKYLSQLYLDKNLRKKQSLYNYTWAKKNVMAQSVLQRLEDIYHDCLVGKK